MRKTILLPPFGSPFRVRRYSMKSFRSQNSLILNWQLFFILFSRKSRRQKRNCRVRFINSRKGFLNEDNKAFLVLSYVNFIDINKLDSQTKYFYCLLLYLTIFQLLQKVTPKQVFSPN